MPLHLAELKKHSEQNEKIISLLEKLVEQKNEVIPNVSDQTKKTTRNYNSGRRSGVHKRDD